MYLYFNKNGTLTTQINHGEVPRQGANLDVHALVDLDFFEEQGDYHLDDWTALLKVVDTLGNTALSGATMNGPELITFVKSNNAEATFNLVNGQNYYAFDFLINSSIYSDVTALSGNIKIGVSFINTDSSLNVVGGECTLYIEPVLKDSYIKNNINPSQYRQLMSKIEQAEFYTSNNNYSVSYNLVVNRNGYQVPNVKFEPISIEQYSGYTVKQLRDNTTNTKIEDIYKIRKYLTAITGSGRIPEYDELKPSDQFIICAVDNTMWKMQYDETNGLLAFKVENVPLLPTTYIKSASVSDNTLTLTKQDNTTQTYTPLTTINTATGTGSFAISDNDSATATGSETLVIGRTKAGGNNSVYIGSSNYPNGGGGGSQVCIGHNYKVGNNDYITAIGHCDVSAVRAIAIGYNSIASADSAISIGSGTSDSTTKPTASGQYSIAIGTGSQANGSTATIAIGHDSKATADNAIAIGPESNVSYRNAIAIGTKVKSNYGAITIGENINNNSNVNLNNVAIGNLATISASYGVAIGTGVSKNVDHNYSVVFNRCKFIPMTKSDSYTLSSTQHGMTLTSSGVTYYAPSSTVTTGASESALLICWYTD